MIYLDYDFKSSDQWYHLKAEFADFLELAEFVNDLIAAVKLGSFEDLILVRIYETAE